MGADQSSPLDVPPDGRPPCVPAIGTTELKVGSNLEPRQPGGLIKDCSNQLAALDNLAYESELQAIKAIKWYLKRKRSQSWLSQGVRWFAVLFVVIGGFSPLLSGMGEVTSLLPKGSNLDHWGYIFIALSAALVALDRFLGFSTTWMRYMTAQMALQRALEKFQLAWAVWRLSITDNAPTAEQHSAAIALLTSFQQQIGDVVDKEMQTWLSEFQQQLSALQAAVDKDKTERAPGNLVVTYSAPVPIDGQADIYVDNQLSRSTSSGAVILTGIAPGSHFVMVKANGGKLQGNATITLTAGQTAQTNIELKVVSATA